MLDSHLPQLGDISSEQKDILQKLMESYSDKIIRIIMKNLQHVTDTSDLKTIADTLKHTFSLDMDESPNHTHMKCPHGHSKKSSHMNGHPHGHHNH